MKKILSLVIAGCFVMVATTSNAQVDTAKKAPSKMEKRKAIKEKIANATPEQKEKIKEKRAEMKAKYDAMTPEEQKAAKEKMKARREAKKAATAPAAKP